MALSRDGMEALSLAGEAFQETSVLRVRERNPAGEMGVPCLFSFQRTGGLSCWAWGQGLFGDVGSLSQIKLMKQLSPSPTTQVHLFPTVNGRKPHSATMIFSLKR